MKNIIMSKPKPCMRIKGCIGDIIYSTPLVRYFSKAYDQKIYIETDNPIFFKNSPFVEEVFDTNKSEKCPDGTVVLDLNEYWINPNGAKFNIRNMYTTDFWSIRFGFTIIPQEKTLEFYPDDYDYEGFDPFKTEYIIVNPSITDACREWGLDNWVDLLKTINNNTDIKIVVTGKSIINPSDSGVKNKGYHELNNIEGVEVVDLTDKLNLSNWHHIIKNSKVIITHNSSGLPMAGTTDAEIIYLGGAIHPHFRVPFRNGSQSYKIHYVHGRCNLFCQSDVRYNSDEKDNHSTVFGGWGAGGYCYEDKPTFECHPKPSQVWNVLSNVLSNNLDF